MWTKEKLARYSVLVMFNPLGIAFQLHPGIVCNVKLYWHHFWVQDVFDVKLANVIPNIATDKRETRQKVSMEEIFLHKDYRS